MHLVEDSPLPGRLRLARVTPCEGGVDHPALLHEGSTIALIERLVLVGMTELVAEEFRAPAQPSDQSLGIGVDQELVRIEAMAGVGLKWTVDTIAVNRAGSGRRQITVPYFVGVFRQLDALELLFAGVVEQT